MPDALLDTTVFIDSFNRHPGVEGLLRQALLQTSTVYYSPITVFELSLRTISRGEEAQHELLISACTEAPFDSQAARILAFWLGSQPRSGRRRLLGDAMIAATAAAIGATIITRNPRDFTRFYADVKSY